MNNEINLKIQFGNNFTEFKININSTISELKSKISSIIESKFNFPVDESSIVIKFGFPPKTNTSPDSNTIRSLNISNNELLRVECKKKEKDISQDKINQCSSKQSLIERVIIPADNSCLFNAINYCLNQSMNQPETMREIVASTIESNPDVYNSAILDKEPSEYCSWIMEKETWGGGIELAILSEFFQIRIGVADITKVTIEYFGEQFDNIIYLLYDGIHYDSLIQNQDNKIIGVFSYKDDKIRLDIIRLMDELNKKNKFTDTKGYSVKCNVCYTLFKGNDDIMAHSKKTGHTNYAQLNKN